MRHRHFTSGLLYFGMAMVTSIFLFPVLWVLSVSLKSPAELFTSPPTLLPKIPEWSNYATVLEQSPIMRNMLNSLIITTGTMLLAVSFATMSAYVVSRINFRGRRLYERAILGCQMISPVILMVALYPVFVRLQLLNSYVPLILVYVAVTVPFLTWFMRGVMDTIPRELDEAAMIDGCSWVGTFLRIIVPAARSGIASAAVLTAVMSWSQFVIPFIMLDNSDLFPISVGVLNLQSTGGATTLQYVAAGSIISIVPVVLIFIIFQRWIVGALTDGAVKG
jgi:multiple sugar transport system permease protein